MWEEVDCVQRNGRIIEYIVIISNNSNTYNLTSTERYITVNDLVLGGIYNISVAAVNSIGSGPFNHLNIILTSTDSCICSTSDLSSTSTGLGILVGILIITQLASGIAIVLLIINSGGKYVQYCIFNAIYFNKRCTCNESKSNNERYSSTNLKYYVYTNRSSDDDISMQVCEPYGLHKSTERECEPSAVYETVIL